MGTQKVLLRTGAREIFSPVEINNGLNKTSQYITNQRRDPKYHTKLVYNNGEDSRDSSWQICDSHAHSSY